MLKSVNEKQCIDFVELMRVKAWRNLVAHFTGGEGVVGSNPAAPTIFCVPLLCLNLLLCGLRALICQKI